MFSTAEYGWSDVTAVVGGRNVSGIRDVSYKPKQEKEVLYAKGNKPHSIQKGNKSYEGSITLTQSEVIALEKAAGTNKDILDISFDLIVSYGNPLNGDAIIIDKITGCQITEIPKGMKQGDKFMECALPFIALDVEAQKA